MKFDLAVAVGQLEEGHIIGAKSDSPGVDGWGGGGPWAWGAREGRRRKGGTHHLLPAMASGCPLRALWRHWSPTTAPIN